MDQNNVIDLRKGRQEPANHTRGIILVSSIGIILVSSIMLVFFIMLMLAANYDVPDRQTAGTDGPRTGPPVGTE